MSFYSFEGLEEHANIEALVVHDNQITWCSEVKDLIGISRTKWCSALFLELLRRETMRFDGGLTERTRGQEEPIQCGSILLLHSNLDEFFRATVLLKSCGLSNHRYCNPHSKLICW